MERLKSYQKFVQVYHFVPLDTKVVRKKNDLNGSRKKGYSGKIQVELKTRTLLFIPDTEERVNQDHKGKHPVQKFFSYDGKTPVIPGSSLRGMLRSAYETVTNSCLSVTDIQEKPVRRNSDIYEPGLLQRKDNGTLTLFEAEKIAIIGCDTEYSAGEEVQVQRVNSKDDRVKKGVIVEAYGEQFQDKPIVTAYYLKKNVSRNRAYVFCMSDNAKIVANNLAPRNPAIQGLMDVLISYQELNKEPEAQYKNYSAGLKEFLKYGIGYFPVYYSKAAEKLYLSPACMTKEVYQNSIEKILEKQGEHQSCTDIRRMCPACELFGMVGENITVDEKREYPNAWAGRLRIQDGFLDAEENADNIYAGEVTLAELASPKKSCSEFYLQKPQLGKKEVLSWTYDYVLARAQKNSRPQLFENRAPKLSGRKFYWHQRMPVTLEDLPLEGIPRTERNCTVNPVKSNVKFEFTVYFQDLSQSQLKQLIWICNISDEADGQGKYGYKLGKGKPLGLGSVELRVKDVQIRTFQQEGKIGYFWSDYQEVFQSDFRKIHWNQPDLEFCQNAMGPFLRLCSFEAIDESETPVIYPCSVEKISKGKRSVPSIKFGNKGYLWGMYNHYKWNWRKCEWENGQVTRRTELLFQEYLHPLSVDNDISLSVNGPSENAGAGFYTYNHYPAAGCILETKVLRGKDDFNNLMVQTLGRYRVTIKVRLDKRSEAANFQVGTKLKVAITSTKYDQKNKKILYEGEIIKAE